MRDQYNREIDYVRISLTDRCNLKCRYCMPENGIDLIPHEEILSLEEIVRVCNSLAKLGIRKVKLTGGEPLLRKNCAYLIRELKQIPGIQSVTLTTNGILLKEQIKELTTAGLDAVNISLDTLDKVKFEQITRKNQLDKVLEGIYAAAALDGLSVKINAVPVDSTPENLVSIASIARELPVHVRFIEMMPIGYGKDFSFLGEERICQILEEQFGTLLPTDARLGNGPGHYYSVDGFKGKIGFISAITHKFCSECNRVRLTPEGFLKACLQFQNGTDLKKLIRGGCTDEVLTEEIRKVIWNKPVGHQFHEKKDEKEESRIMSQIGG